jgi:hypothetical protein
VVAALDSWRQTSLFVDNILQDLFRTAEPLAAFVAHQLRLKQEREAPPFSKYPQPFVSNLRRVRALPATALCYETLARTRDLPALVQSLQQAQLDLGKTVGRAEHRSRVEELRTKVEEAMEEVERVSLD